MTDPARPPLRAFLLVGLLLGTPVSAQDGGDPTWPCVQRKVEHLSSGVMWPHAVPEDATPLPPDFEDVAARLALRRVSKDEALAMVRKVAAHPGLGLAEYGQLFQAAFARIDAERAEIVAGIGRYAGNQTRLAAEIRDLEAEMDWRVRVFRDRSRALTFVCESPVLLDQRACAIAQMLLEAAG